MDGKKVVFAGAGFLRMGTPWGTLGGVARRAMEPLGYEVDVEILSWGGNNPRYVSDGRADFGATQYRAVEDAYQGTGGREPIGKNLRMIATINQPAWIAVAFNAASGIQDLAEVSAKQLPIRVKLAGERAITLILEHYGLSREKILGWGGRMVGVDEGAERDLPGEPPARWSRDWNEIAPWVKSGDFDLIIEPIYAAYTFEHKHWTDASVLHDLRFQPLPQELIDRIMANNAAEAPGFIPHRLMRGIDHDIPTVQRFPQAIYTRAEAPDDFVYDVAKALDAGHHLFRQTHMPYSYDPANVALPRLVPLHPGAQRYYQEVGYVSQVAISS